MHAEAEFVGGPLNGKRIPLDDPMEPSPRIILGQAKPRARALVYLLEPNPADDGPLWLYRYEDPELRL